MKIPSNSRLTPVGKSTIQLQPQSISTSTPLLVSPSTLPSSSGSKLSVPLKRIGSGSPPKIKSKTNPLPVAERTVEEKRLLIRKQLVILLHAILCRRRDNLIINNRDTPAQPCNVPFCGLMKTVLSHLNSCKAGRGCITTHCASSRQILIHWKFCVKVECPVCVSLRQVVPTSLLTIFPNPLCQAEVMVRRARHQQEHGNDDPQPLFMPELMQSEE